MRSIFWIGCILVVLVSLLASGAIAESANNSTVQATKDLNVNMTAAPEQAPVSEAVSSTMTNETAPVADTNVTNVSTEQPAAEADLVNDTLVKFVTDARTFAKNSGKEAAIATFKNPMGGFVNDKMYIFAYDYDGKALALPYSPGSDGTIQIGNTDSSGFRYVQAMKDMAKSGKNGFIKYTEADLMNKGVITKKVSYVTDVDGNYWIGAGVYMSDEKKPAVTIVAKPTTVESPVDVNATMPAETSSSMDQAITANVTASNATAVTA